MNMQHYFKRVFTKFSFHVINGVVELFKFGAFSLTLVLT